MKGLRPMTAFISVQHLQKQYAPPHGVFALGKKEGVSFEIQQGEIFSLLGPNGAGKSTCINIMSTLLQATSGDVLVNGHSVHKNPLAVKKLIGVVPQDLALYPSLSARQNLEFFGRMYGLNGKALKKQVDAVLEMIDLKERADDKIETYSGGMKRRVNIAVGLIHEPKMVFLDEPTVAIDPQSRRSILDTVKRLNQAGMTVLYTTHYMEEAQELSHRVGIIDQGEIIALGTLDQLIQQIGESDTLIFKVLGTLENSLEATLHGIQGVEGVALKPEEATVEVVAKGGRRLLPHLVSALDAAALTLSSVEIRQPNLEAVFLKMTGRALRD
jgi:ABC-2 type transport system ATP-binding protein